MTVSAIIFYVLASIAVVSGLLVIWSRHAVHSAIYLVLCFLCIAAIYVVLEAEFVAAVQVLVYAGGIMVLFLFVIMLVNLRDVQGRRVRLHATFSSIIGLGVLGIVLYVYGKASLPGATASPSLLRAGGNLQNVGWEMLRSYVLPFEIASILLLVAMIGAIVLARQKA